MGSGVVGSKGGSVVGSTRRRVIKHFYVQISLHAAGPRSRGVLLRPNKRPFYGLSGAHAPPPQRVRGEEKRERARERERALRCEKGEKRERERERVRGERERELSCEKGEGIES